MRRPQPLVPRYLRFDVPERVAADGTVLLPLDEARVRQLARELKQQHVQAVAVGLLHSYLRPAHAERIRDILADALPGRSEERRVGIEWGSTGRSRWWREHVKKKTVEGEKG